MDLFRNPVLTVLKVSPATLGPVSPTPSPPLRHSSEAIISRASEVRSHFEQIVASRAFNRSRRSCEFLEHLVDKTLAGETGNLKERVIGVELFGRDPCYDTGEDAIVRVTATDVRRRLRRFYDGVQTGLRLELPPGSYSIELIEQPDSARPGQGSAGRQEQAPNRHQSQDQDLDQSQDQGLDQSPNRDQDQVRSRSLAWRRIPLLAAVLAGAAVLLGAYQYGRYAAKSGSLPWSAMLPRQGQLKIVFSDPDLVVLEQLAGNPVSLSDYADHQYLADPPLVYRSAGAVARLFRGDNVPTIDASLALNVRGILPRSPISVYRARTLQSQDFKTEDNFILLGSPISDPWVALFEDRLDFYLRYDPSRREEVVYNRRVGSGERAVYVPTFPGWGTVQAYAIIGLVANQNEAGRILILAGSNAAATEAAYRLATDIDSLGRALREHGIDAHDREAQFEILLGVNTVASSLSNFEVVACHRLPGRRE